jgi:hypothetical protein
VIIHGEASDPSEVGEPMSGRVPTVLIAGAGQLGSRYLQGLAKCRTPLRIVVQDPFAPSLERAEERWREVAGADIAHNVSFRESFASLPERTDVAIVATTADVRPDVVAAVSRCSGVRFWILEKVLTQSEAALDDLIAQVGRSSSAWVNTPRRIMPWHRDVKAALTTDGGAWGLACNAVHFLDLCAWWTGEALDRVETGGLDSTWGESKRAGFQEVFGTLEAHFAGGSRAVLSARTDAIDFTATLREGGHTWALDEDAGMARRDDGLEIPGRLLYQSEMSGPMVERILQSGECDLPTLAEAAVMHRTLIGALREHWVGAGHPDASSVPVT